MTEIEKEFEKENRIGKTKVGLLVCGVLVAVLAISSVWLFIRVDNFQTQVNWLTSENDDLGWEIAYLTSENNDLQWEYDEYVADHQYTDEEYDEARFSLYYIKPEQKFGVYDLEDELNGLEWIEPYQENVFDCSEMSAYLEWYLENEGWHAEIVLGDTPFGSGYHAWLLVETSKGEYVPVESESFEVVWSSDPNFDNYWIYDHRFEAIQDALSYSRTEFDWWTVYP